MLQDHFAQLARSLVEEQRRQEEPSSVSLNRRNQLAREAGGDRRARQWTEHMKLNVDDRR